jgi:hypothetical protein
MIRNAQIAEDRPELQRLENIVKEHKTIGTAALSLESGVRPERIYALFTNHFSSVSRNAHPVGPSFDVWTYIPTMAEKAAEYESKEQQNQLDLLRKRRCSAPLKTGHLWPCLKQGLGRAEIDQNRRYCRPDRPNSAFTQRP